jgi:hypothetical protein
LHLAWDVRDFSRCFFSRFFCEHCWPGIGPRRNNLVAVSRPKVAVSNRVNNEKRKEGLISKKSYAVVRECTVK